MKIRKILCLMVILGIFFIYKNVYAASAGISINRTSAYVGDNVTVTVSCNAATWNLHLSGAINDNEVGVNLDGGNKDCGRSWTIDTSTPGNYSVSLSGDISDWDNTTSDVGGSVSVSISERPQQNNNGGGSGGLIPVQPSNNNNNNNSNNNNSNNDNNKQEDKKEEKKSDNSKIKTLTVDNYDLKKINDNKYELTVDNKVNMVNIKAVAADSKATVKGNGVHELIVGENKIEIVITAEDGSKNTITIIVTREEESIEVEPTTTIGTTDSEPENKINIISIIMIGLNIVLGIAVITLFIKNKKLKDSLIINK